MAAFNWKSYIPQGMNPGKGYVQGAKMREDVTREQEKSSRADEYLGIAKEDANIRKETQGWKREDREKETSIQEGMAEAGQSGGYEGVISFLKQVDPTRALAFHKAKLSLDKDIMNNDVLKSVSKVKKEQAMVESYGVLGKMGHALTQAPEEDQQAMYKQMLPMIKKVNPNAPTSYNKQAESMMLLASAQATPANQTFKANATLAADRSRLGKLNSDIENRQARGQTASNNSGTKSLIQERERVEANSLKASLSLTEQTLKAAERDRDDQQKQLRHAQSLSKNISDQSKSFTKFTEASTQIEASLQTLNKDPGNYPAKAMIGRAIAKMANGVGVLTQPDVDELIRSSASHKKALKLAETVSSGKKVDLSANEMEDLISLYKAMEGTALTKQAATESAYEDQISKYPGAVDINNVIMPSQAYKSFKNKMAVDSRKSDEGQQFLQSIPKELQGFAKEALENGVSVDALKARMQQMQQGQGNQ